MESVADLFGGYHLLSKKGGIRDERSSLVQYFFENARREWNGLKPLAPSYIGLQLAHLSLFDLYAFKSMCEERSKSGYPWGKYFWGSLKSRT